MNFKLKAISDSVDWPTKQYGRYPDNPDLIRYAWPEEEAQFAEPFFKHGVLTPETPAVVRSLCLGQEASGRWLLCVVEEPRKLNMEQLARDFSLVMDPSKLNAAILRALGEGGAEKS